MPFENLCGFPMRCWFFRDCFSFCLGCLDCWLVTLFLSVSFGWFFEIHVLCHTLRFCFYFLRLFANVFEMFESVWDFLEGIFSQTPMLQNASKWSCWNFWRSYFQGQYQNLLYNIVYPNIWARVDFLKICSKFFLISVCILQFISANPLNLTTSLVGWPGFPWPSWTILGSPAVLRNMACVNVPGEDDEPAGLEFPGNDVELQWRSWNSELEFTHFSWNSWSQFASSPFEEDTYLVWSGSLLQDISFVQSLDDQTTRFQYVLIVDLFHHDLGKLIVMSKSFQGKPTRNDTYLIQRQTMFIQT